MFYAAIRDWPRPTSKERAVDPELDLKLPSGFSPSFLLLPQDLEHTHSCPSSLTRLLYPPLPFQTMAETCIVCLGDLRTGISEEQLQAGAAESGEDGSRGGDVKSKTRGTAKRYHTSSKMN